MRKLVTVTLLASVVQCLGAPSAMAGACDGVDRQLTQEDRAALELVMAKKLGAPAAKVLAVWALGVWTIVAVEPPAADVGYLFFSGSPLDSSPVAVWGGAAVQSAEEETRIGAWVLEHAPGIPEQLARCFASTVTGAGRAVPPRK